MGKTATVLILGGGTGGVVAANVLGKALSKKHRIILVDRNDRHYFKPSYPFVLVNQRRLAQISRKLHHLQKKGVELIQAGVEQVRPELCRVETTLGPLTYDYLVIALGAELHPETVPGLEAGAYIPYLPDQVEALRQKLLTFKKGKIVLFIASLPYSGVIGPLEIMFLLDSYFRQRGVRNQIELTMVTPETAPLPLAGPKVGASVREAMEQREIRFIAGARVLALDANKGRLLLDHGISVPGDLFLGIPSHWGPKALRYSGLTEKGGWITVDPATFSTKADRVYAVGDATALRVPASKVWAPKAGIFAHFQAEVVARNIIALITGKEPSFRFTGKAAGAVLATGLKEGRIAYINYYARPEPRFILLRPSKAAYLVKVAFEKYWLTRWF